VDTEIAKLNSKISALTNAVNDQGESLWELKGYADTRDGEITKRLDDAVHQVVDAAKTTERVALANSEHALQSFRNHVLAFTREIY
jgi:hypothetical protein